MMYYVGTLREWSVVMVIKLHWHWPTTLIITKKDYIVIILKKKCGCSKIHSALYQNRMFTPKHGRTVKI